MAGLTPARRHGPRGRSVALVVLLAYMAGATVAAIWAYRHNPGDWAGGAVSAGATWG